MTQRRPFTAVMQTDAYNKAFATGPTTPRSDSDGKVFWSGFDAAGSGPGFPPHAPHSREHALWSAGYDYRLTLRATRDSKE